MRRGEVWIAEHPTLGRRPYLLLTRDEVLPRIAAPLCAQITTRRRDLPTEVALDEEDGMRHACVVSLDNVAPLPKRALVHLVTRLSPARMREVCRALTIAAGC